MRPDRPRTRPPPPPPLQIFERKPTTVKNFGIWVRYNSRTGVHNAYKEYRDCTLNGAVEQLYHEMGSRHRTRASQMQIIKTATVKAADVSKLRGVGARGFDRSAGLKHWITRQAMGLS